MDEYYGWDQAHGKATCNDVFYIYRVLIVVVGVGGRYKDW